jgi:hypothetical protein
MKKRNDRIGRTATGRSKLEYNKRVRSDRKWKF